MEEIMNIGSNLSSSFAYAKDGLVGQWVKWILLIISAIIFPLLMGYQLRVMRGESPAPEVGNWGKTFIDGILYLIIAIIYAIPIIIVSTVFTTLALSTGNAALALVGTLLSVIIAIAISLIELIGIVNFARKESIGAAFAIGDILAKIGEIGWISLLIQLIVLEIVLGVIYFVLMLIPIVGMLLLLILCPLFAIWEAKYISNVYDNAQ